MASFAAEKQTVFQSELSANGVTTIPGTIASLRELRQLGVRTALVTSSRNGPAIETAAGVTGLLDERPDGNDLKELGLEGKPSPALFLEACRRLALDPASVAVVEDADSIHYPGTYFAGVYNTVTTERNGITAERESMVNSPNWLPLWFRIDGGDWFSPAQATLLDFRQELDLRSAVLTRDLRFRDGAGRITRVRSRRLLSQASVHTAFVETTIEPENWSGAITVRSAIDGRVTNRAEEGSALLERRHLTARKTVELDDESILLEMETIRSGIHIAMAARTRAFEGADQLSPTRSLLVDEMGWVAHELEVSATVGCSVRIEKVVVVHTSRDRAIASPAEAAQTLLGRMPGADALLAAHERAWQILWDEFRVTMDSGARQSLALNLNTFHILQTLASVTADLDAGIPARGLHGEGYGGHVF